MVELIVNNNKIELPKDSNIKYTKQISDIFDIASVSVSYTNTFDFEKTPANTQSMQQLGISGDNSQIPYIKNDAQLKADGFDLISKGWFNIQSTDDNYKGSILNGMVDFFKAIENKTMGKDLNLQNFNHEKILSTVVNSFNNIYYNYLIADYGGKLVYNEGINIDYQAPSFSVKELWKLIFSTFGFNCDYTNLEYIDGLYITYPKDTAEGQENELVAVMTKGPFQDYRMASLGGVSSIVQEQRSWTTSAITEGYLLYNWNYICPETTSYLFDLTSEMYVVYRQLITNKKTNVNPRVDILKNGIVAGSILASEGIAGEARSLLLTISCDAGDVIEVFITSPTTSPGGSIKILQWRHNSTILNVYKTDLGTVNLENELKDFLVKDFIKEILWRTGLTPIYELESNTVKFIKLDSRIDFDNAQDMSHTFVKRTNEIYANDYAQKNVFALKKNDETDLTGDGYLYVFNRNLEDEKTIVSSKIYAPDKKQVTENWFEIKSNQYKIWQIEIKEDQDAGPELQISYKGLSGRFYFLRKQTVDRDGIGYKLISEKLNDEQEVPQIHIGINTDTLFEEAVYNNYQEYQRIFSNFRIHSIEQVLTINDFIGLDLTRPVFFKQENAFYICNKVPYEEGKNSVGEFIKINKV